MNHRLLVAPAVLALVLLASSCPEAKPAVAGPAPDARIAELVEALSPLPDTVTSDVSDQHFHRGNRLLAELSAAPPEIGRAALRALQERKEKVILVDRGLLIVAAKSATADALPLLENLVSQYGPSLDLRTEAALVMAEVAPERLIPIIEPMVLRRARNQTTPPVEFLVAAWVTACDKTGRDPVPELCDVATNLFQEGSARVRAVAELGKRPDPRGRKALEALLVESTGDGYLRRKAAQSLLATLPQETACALFRKVGDKEADLNMLQFLANMVDRNCGS